MRLAHGAVRMRPSKGASDPEHRCEAVQADLFVGYIQMGDQVS